MRPTFIILLIVTFALGCNAQPKTDNLAITFLNSLTEDQSDRCNYSFGHNIREIWSFLPGSIIWRPGLKLSELTENQNTLLFDLLEASLSESGYSKVQKIIDLENVLAEIEGDTVFRNPDNYFVAFYGTPKTDSLWGWSFEGHHLSLKFTISPNGTAVVPRFMGASPATILSGPREGERTLDKEEDFGIQLIQSMTIEQKEKAIFRKDPYFDIVTQNAIEVSPLTEVGIQMKELNGTQKEILEKLIYEYLSSLPSVLANERFTKIKNENFDEIRFGWAGSTDANEGHYYRIQGESFLVEFDNFLNNANHIHTVWREFAGDFGRDLILEHYINSDHHK